MQSLMFKNEHRVSVPEHSAEEIIWT